MKTVLIISSLLISTAVYADSYRCGNKLVTEGMTYSEVFGVCPKQPAFKRQWSETKYDRSRDTFQTYNWEVWLYQDPNKYDTEVIFLNGRVHKIQSTSNRS